MRAGRENLPPSAHCRRQRSLLATEAVTLSLSKGLYRANTPRAMQNVRVRIRDIALVLVKILFVSAIFFVCTNSVLSEHVRGYTRKDGTRVSDYERGSTRNVSSNILNDWVDRNPGAFAAACVVLLVAVLIIVAVMQQKKKRATVERVQDNASSAIGWIQRIQTGQFTPPDTPVLLRPGEMAILCEPSELVEAKATRFYGGAGTRIKGIYIGGGASHPVDSLTRIDSGTLTLTTQRIVFDGNMQNRSAEAKQIISLKAYADAIEIATSKRSKSQLYVVGNPLLWEGVIKLVISGDMTVKQTRIPEAIEGPSSKDITFSCENCGQNLVVDKAGIGTSVPGPKCGTELVIPA